MTLRDFSEGVEESTKRTEEEIGHLQTITGPYFCRVIAQERFPGLATAVFWASLAHTLLKSPLETPPRPR
jgi:hypothetical protein